MKGSALKIIQVLGLIIAGITCVKSQDTTVTFYHIIRDDSVEMFFSNSYNFTEQGCAENRRYTRIDTYGDFFQTFTDLNSDNTVIARGFYSEGQKNGLFETFYPNGQLKSKGNYKDGRPVGDWFYFYPDGKPERQLLVNAADTFLLQFYDVKGQHTVVDGNGVFNGAVAANDRFFHTQITAAGNIVHGKADGEWKSFLGDRPYCTEKFDKGVFISGEQTSIMLGRKKYNNLSYLRYLFLNSYIESLEQFRVVKCPTFKFDTAGAVVRNNTNMDFKFDRTYVNDAVNKVIDDDTRNGNYKEYLMGENFLKFSFKVNKDGTPVDFKQLTSWGDQYYYPVTTALSMHAKLPTSTSMTYFQLIIIKSVGNTITYRYNFLDN